MKIGIAMPGVPDGPGLKRFAKRADELGFESLLLGDHIVLPTGGSHGYPYTADGSFIRASETPFLEMMTLLGYIAACTGTIKIGTTVIILPYRNPVVMAKMYASLDVLSEGRIICGVGVGWLEKEFETLGVPFAQRGVMSDEFIEIFKVLWTEPDPSYHGRFYQFDGIQFYPKPVQKPHIPIWIGGHTRAALRRTAKYGDRWHTTRQTPEYVAQQIPYLRQRAERAGRDPAGISISLKRTVHVTDLGIPEGTGTQSLGALIVPTQEVIDDLHHCHELGIDQLTYGFRAADLDGNLRMMEHLADQVLPVAQRLG